MSVVANVHHKARAVASLLTIVCATVLLGGYAGSGVASGASSAAIPGRGPGGGGALTVDIPTGPENLDVYTSNDNESIWALQDVAEGLFRNASNGRSVVPWLATGYKLSPNKLTWTFELRRGVRFSNGRPMASKDVVWSLEQATGYPHGGFTVDFIAARADPIQTPVAHMVATALAPLGITVKTRLLAPSKVEAEEHAFHYGMRETYWTNDVVDRDEYTAFTLCGSASRCGGVYANFTHFDRPEDRHPIEGETTLGSRKRAAIYGRIQQLAAHAIPMVWLGYSPFSYVYSSNVRGYHVETQGNTHFEDVRLSK